MELSQAERSEAPPGRAKRGAVAERSEAFGPSEARRYPEPREGRKRKQEATKRGATQLLQAKHGAAKRILGDEQADKSINPSQHAQPSFGTFLILVVFVVRGDLAFVFS